MSRLKQLSYGEVLTTADVINLLTKAQQKELEKNKKEKTNNCSEYVPKFCQNL